MMKKLSDKLGNKRIVVSVLLVILLVSGITLFTSSKKAFANDHPISTHIEPQLRIDNLVDNDLNEKDASQIAKGLIEKGKGNKNEGWLHVAYKITSEVDNGVILPDGRPMPSSYIEDAWYFVNKNGLVEKSVVSLKDETGSIFQQAVFTGNIETNLTFGTKMENLTPYELKLDRGFLQYLTDAETLKISIKIQDEKYKDNPNKKFSFTENYNQPIQFNGEHTPPVESAFVSGLFSNETGELTLYRKVLKHVDGKEVLFEECELLFMEFVSEPPIDVLTVLESAQ